MAALIELDNKNQTDWSRTYLADGGPWQQYCNEDKRRRLSPVAEIMALLTAQRHQDE